MESLGCFSVSNTQGAAAFKNVYFSKRYSNKKLKNQDPVEICANMAAVKKKSKEKSQTNVGSYF